MSFSAPDPGEPPYGDPYDYIPEPEDQSDLFSHTSNPSRPKFVPPDQLASHIEHLPTLKDLSTSPEVLGLIRSMVSAETINHRESLRGVTSHSLGFNYLEHFPESSWALIAHLLGPNPGLKTTSSVNPLTKRDLSYLQDIVHHTDHVRLAKSLPPRPTWGDIRVYRLNQGFAWWQYHSDGTCVVMPCLVGCPLDMLPIRDDTFIVPPPTEDYQPRTLATLFVCAVLVGKFAMGRSVVNSVGWAGAYFLLHFVSLHINSGLALRTIASGNSGLTNISHWMQGDVENATVFDDLSHIDHLYAESTVVPPSEISADRPLLSPTDDDDHSSLPSMPDRWSGESSDEERATEPVVMPQPKEVEETTPTDDDDHSSHPSMPDRWSGESSDEEWATEPVVMPQPKEVDEIITVQPIVKETRVIRTVLSNERIAEIAKEEAAAICYRNQQGKPVRAATAKDKEIEYCEIIHRLTLEREFIEQNKGLNLTADQRKRVRRRVKRSRGKIKYTGVFYGMMVMLGLFALASAHSGGSYLLFFVSVARDKALDSLGAKPTVGEVMAYAAQNPGDLSEQRVVVYRSKMPAGYIVVAKEAGGSSPRQILIGDVLSLIEYLPFLGDPPDGVTGVQHHCDVSDLPMANATIISDDGHLKPAASGKKNFKTEPPDTSGMEQWSLDLELQEIESLLLQTAMKLSEEEQFDDAEEDE